MVEQEKLPGSMFRGGLHKLAAGKETESLT
jgi:hypothetical protein